MRAALDRKVAQCHGERLFLLLGGYQSYLRSGGSELAVALLVPDLSAQQDRGQLSH